MSLCSDKRDILDLVKLSYIIVRTGIGTGQIQVTQTNSLVNNHSKLDPSILMFFEQNQIFGSEI